MHSLPRLNDVSTALDRYIKALHAYSDACDAARCAGVERPSVRQLLLVEDAKVVLLAARRAYQEARRPVVDANGAARI